jgi:glyoxylase-like metal-dependent hydrolase (beta-lactamase superfamily II)
MSFARPFRRRRGPGGSTAVCDPAAMDVQELAPGLWIWTTPHPEWTPDERGPDGWEAPVTSLYHEAAEAVCLVDPLVPAEPAERDRFLAALDRDVDRLGRAVAILVTVHWHVRSAPDLAARYPGATIWAHGRALERMPAGAARPFAAGDPLPGGLETLDAQRGDEVLVWIRAQRTLVAGDVLLGGEGGVRVCPDSWLPAHLRGGELRRRLRPLLDLPVERLVLGHGGAITDDAAGVLRRTLAG